MFRTLAIAFSLLVGSAVVGNEQSAMTNEEALDREIDSLDWHFEGIYKMPSHSTLTIPPKHKAVFGSEARKLWSLVGGSSTSSPEACIDSNSSSVTLRYNKNGCMPSKDLRDLDHNKILSVVHEALGKKGRFIGWIKKPWVDERTNTVFFAFEFAENNIEEHFIASYAFKYGRFGAEEITWVANISEYKDSGGELDVILEAFCFDPGYRCADLSERKRTAVHNDGVSPPLVARKNLSSVDDKDVKKEQLRKSDSGGGIPFSGLVFVLLLIFGFRSLKKHFSSLEDPFRYIWDLSILEQKYREHKRNQHQTIKQFYERARLRIDKKTKQASCFFDEFFSKVEDEMIRIKSLDMLGIKTLEYANELAEAYGYNKEETTKEGFFCPGWNKLWELNQCNKERILFKKSNQRKWNDCSEDFEDASQRASDGSYNKSGHEHNSGHQRTESPNTSSKNTGSKNKEIFEGIWDLKELKKKYFKLAKLNHPDQGGSNQRMKLLNQYYQEALQRIWDKDPVSENERKYKIVNKDVWLGDPEISIVDEIIKFCDANEFYLALFTNILQFLNKNQYVTAEQYSDLVDMYYSNYMDVMNQENK